MTQSDPDLLSQLESNRFPKAAKDGSSTGVQTLLREKKSNGFWNEIISLRLMPPSSSPSSSSSSVPLKTYTVVEWNVPRFRLTESFLHDAVNRESSATFILSHLFDPKTQTVILPSEDMQSQCHTSVVYDVIVHHASRIKHGGVLDRVGDSYYKGDMIFHIQNIPKLSDSGKYQVVAEDVHRWLIHGATCGDESVEVLSMKLATLKKTLNQLEKDMNNIHAVPIYNENGRSIVGSPLKVAREANLKRLEEITKLTKQQVMDVEQELNTVRANHISTCELEITQRGTTGEDTSTNDTISFAVKMVGKETKKEYYTNLICNATNWSSEPMYATGDRTSNIKQPMLSDEGVTREERLVDVSKVTIVMLPDGFGVHESYYTDGNSSASSECNIEVGITRNHHRLYHGHFQEGDYCDGTLHTNSGVYCGTFLSNEPCHGTMKYSDKIVITGGYALSPEVDGSPLGSNPYRRGLHHDGNVSIRFKDGATYEGEMRNGVIAGVGVYKYPNDGM